MRKKAQSTSALKVWGHVKVETADDELLYQSPPEEVEVRTFLHYLYERRRAWYCQLTRGIRIPEHYRTGVLPPHGFIFEVLALEARIILRRIKLWRKEHHLATFSIWTW